MQIIYVTKEEISHPDNAIYSSRFSMGCKDIKLNHLEENTKDIESLVLNIKSRKTGNESRHIVASPIEIDGLSGIYRMIWSKRMIRKRERVFNLFTGKEYEATPIARVKYAGYVIYKLKEL